jgi:nickel-dependent lactate racemase
MAGFGGGPKAVMPGVSNFEFIRRYHLSTFLPRLHLGQTSGNPNYDEICEAARLARLDFIVNAVYSTQHEVMNIVAGDFEKAHKAGVQMSLEQYAVKVEPSADVTIVSAFPYDENRQVLKSLVPAAMVTKKGGTIILVASASHDGQLPDPLFNAYGEVWAQVNGDPAKTAVEYIKQGRLIVQGGPMELNVAVYLNLLMLGRVRVILVSPDLMTRQATRLGFQYASTIEQAIEMVATKMPEATVNVLPLGGVIVPLVKDELTFS